MNSVKKPDKLGKQANPLAIGIDLKINDEMTIPMQSVPVLEAQLEKKVMEKQVA
jgi:hypothetical protein